MAIDKNVIAQIIGITGTIFYFFSYQFKDNRKLFSIQFISYICYVIHLIILGALTGALSYIVESFRVFCLSSKNPKLNSKTMCYIFCILQIIVGIITWDNYPTLLPVLANIASTIAGYSHNALKIRLTGIFINSPLWIIYYVIIGSYAGIIDEVITEISMIYSIIRFGTKDLDEKNE